jgi:hypothetical protein
MSILLYAEFKYIEDLGCVQERNPSAGRVLGLEESLQRRVFTAEV